LLRGFALSVDRAALARYIAAVIDLWC